MVSAAPTRRAGIFFIICKASLYEKCSESAELYTGSVVDPRHKWLHAGTGSGRDCNLPQLLDKVASLPVALSGRRDRAGKCRRGEHSVSSEERRGGKECVRTGSLRWWQCTRTK